MFSPEVDDATYNRNKHIVQKQAVDGIGSLHIITAKNLESLEEEDVEDINGICAVAVLTAVFGPEKVAASKLGDIDQFGGFMDTVAQLCQEENLELTTPTSSTDFINQLKSGRAIAGIITSVPYDDKEFSGQFDMSGPESRDNSFKIIFPPRIAKRDRPSPDILHIAAVFPFGPEGPFGYHYGYVNTAEPYSEESILTDYGVTRLYSESELIEGFRNRTVYIIAHPEDGQESLLNSSFGRDSWFDLLGEIERV